MPPSIPNPPLLPDELAVIQTDGILRVAASPVPLTFETTLLAADEGGSSHEVRLRLRFTLIPANSEADRRLLRQTFLASRTRVRASDVLGSWTPQLQAALALPAASLSTLLPTPDQTLVASIRKTLASLAYLAGFETPHDITLTAESPSYQLRQTTERLERQRQQEESRRLESVRRTADLLAEVREKGLSPADVLSRATPDEAQSLLLSALANESTSAPPARLFAVAGNTLIQVSPTPQGFSPTTHNLPSEQGPLRSVYLDFDTLLIGARDGILTLPLSDLTKPTLYRDHPQPTEHGFSFITRSGPYLYALHRQRGLVVWHLDNPKEPLTTLRPAMSGPVNPLVPPPLPLSQDDPSRSILQTQAPTAATGSATATNLPSALYPWQNNAVVAAFSQLELLTPETIATRSNSPTSPTTTPSLSGRTLFLALTDDVLTAVTDSGHLHTFDPLSLHRTQTIPVNEPILTASAFPSPLGTRLIVSTPTSLLALSPRDAATLRYLSAHRSLKEVAASPTLVAAISPDRMRLILWHPHIPQRPAAELHLATLTKSRLADLVIA